MMVRVISTGDLGVERGVWDQGADGIPVSQFEGSVFDWAEPVVNSSSGKKARATSGKRKLVELEPVAYPQPPAIELGKLKAKKE